MAPPVVPTLHRAVPGSPRAVPVPFRRRPARPEAVASARHRIGDHRAPWGGRNGGRAKSSPDGMIYGENLRETMVFRH